MEIIDELVDIVLTDDGEPAAFVRGRFEFEIVGQPQAHFTRSAWWESSSAPERIDVEFWRVDAGRDVDDLTRYELRHDADGSWSLAAAWP